MNTRVNDLALKLRGGVLPAMATPLDEDGQRVDRTAVLPLVNFLLERGVAGLFVGGTTGEGLLLDEAARYILHEEVTAAAAGRVPLLLHVGANNTAVSLRLAGHAARLAPAAIVAITPTFYPLPDDALLDHFRQLAEAAPETPLFVYDIPHMAVNGIGPALLVRLGEAIPTLAGVKTSRPDAQAVRQLIDAAPDGVLVMAGNERIALGMLALGADGLISGLATAVPEPFVALVETFRRGDVAGARVWQRRINRLLDKVPAGARIGAIKTILAERGVPVGPPVPPRPLPARALWPAMQSLIDGA